MIALHNGSRVSFQDVPVLPTPEFRSTVIEAVACGNRMTSFFGVSDGQDIRLLAILAQDATGTLSIASTRVIGSYPSLTPDCSQAHWFEREIWEQTGVVPKGHPWLKPIRFTGGNAGIADFFRVEGAEVHEVAVGPVHAGVIEPGHFRFQCHGERVMHLEIALGFQHRGIERALVGGPNKRTVHYMETAAGDTTIGHAMAYAMNVDSLASAEPSARADVIRSIALELERMANHTGDLGALAGDVGYLPTASYCGRLRGDFLNLTALVCGSRFGRGLVRPGGVGFDIETGRGEQIAQRLSSAFRDVGRAVDLLWDSPSVMARFDGTGGVSREIGQALGLVGPAARACGIDRDVRKDHPSGMYRFAQIPTATGSTGDVFARAQVRWLEIQRSASFVLARLKAVPEGDTRRPLGPLAPNSLAVSLVEGWRGEICHVAITNKDGRFSAYKIVDPSFHNWMGLALALREQQISDFPLCNKSFNLSYCGHDL